MDRKRASVSSSEETQHETAKDRFADLKATQIDIPLGLTLLVDPGDYSSDLILREGIYEIPETDLVTRLVRPGDTCVDGGCHLGYYTCLMARLTGPEGRVFAFDANPSCCERTKRNLELNDLRSAEVTHAALGDNRGTTSFYISADDQTGLSSLGRIEHCKKIISVPWLRLEDFVIERGIQNIRLLKLDVEGAEEIVLMGLGRILAACSIDFILLECYDERLRLLNSSTADVARLLEGAGYVSWGYGTKNPSGWSRAGRVQSRGDCNYLFVSPKASEPITQVSLAGAFSIQVRKLVSDIEWLNGAATEREQELARLRHEKRQLEATLRAIENSRGWRLLNAYRRVRDALLMRSRRDLKARRTERLH